MILVPIVLLQTIVLHNGATFLAFALTVLVYPSTLVSFFIIDRGRGPPEALALAYSLVLGNLARFLMLMLLSLGLMAAGVLTLGVGLIWVVPFLSIVSGVIHAEAVGLQRVYGH